VSAGEARGRILLIDDDEGIRKAYGMVLEAVGEVTTAADGSLALERLRAQRFDVVVSDLVMPNLMGDEFLRAVRLYDLDIPVILVTGRQDAQVMARAAEYGAFGYLIKPVPTPILTAVARRAMSVGRLARLKREALEVLGERARELGDRAGLETRFAVALEGLSLAHQPIVSVQTGGVVGYEALARCAEPTLSSPLALLDAAQRLGQTHELGRSLRQVAAEALMDAPEQISLFVNVSAAELTDPQLTTEANPLASQAARVVLEITERQALHTIPGLWEKIAQLRALGFRIAADDFGAGYAGFSSLTLLQPDFIKLDMALIRGLEASPRKRALVSGMVALARELSIRTIIEGVETTEERDALVAEGADLMQGFLFARPGRGFPRPGR
jgi:EAL domain-containing protein (putative c-di-GMP-specific phosphodiesterase class I)/AmiR/NasT family two-component response regulator